MAIPPFRPIVVDANGRPKEIASTDTLLVPRLSGLTTITPAVSVSGLGTGATATLDTDSSDLSGAIILTAGSGLSGLITIAPVVTITSAAGYYHKPRVIFFPLNTNAKAAPYPGMCQTDDTSTPGAGNWTGWGATVTLGLISINVGQQYKWGYVVIG